MGAPRKARGAKHPRSKYPWHVGGGWGFPPRPPSRALGKTPPCLPLSPFDQVGVAPERTLGGQGPAGALDQGPSVRRGGSRFPAPPPLPCPGENPTLPAFEPCGPSRGSARKDLGGQGPRGPGASTLGA